MTTKTFEGIRFNHYTTDRTAFMLVVRAENDVKTIDAWRYRMSQRAETLVSTLKNKGTWVVNDVAGQCSVMAEDSFKMAQARASLDTTIAVVKEYIRTLDDDLAARMHLADFYNAIQYTKVVSEAYVEEDIRQFAKANSEDGLEPPKQKIKTEQVLRGL